VIRTRRLEVLHSLLLPDLIRYGERGEQEEVEAGLELYRRNRKRLDRKARRLMQAPAADEQRHDYDGGEQRPPPATATTC